MPKRGPSGRRRRLLLALVAVVGLVGMTLALTVGPGAAQQPPVGDLTLVKVVDNTGGGTLGPDDFGLTIDGNPTTSGATVTVAEGDHTIDETGHPDYTEGTWTCVDPNRGTLVDNEPGPTNVTISAGAPPQIPVDDVTCTITNTFIPPTTAPLAFTGSETTWLAVSAVMLLGLGGLLMLESRRVRRQTDL